MPQWVFLHCVIMWDYHEHGRCRRRHLLLRAPCLGRRPTGRWLRRFAWLHLDGIGKAPVRRGMKSRSWRCRHGRLFAPPPSPCPSPRPGPLTIMPCIKHVLLVCRGYKLAKAVIDSLSYHWDGHLGCCLPESSPCFRSNLPWELLSLPFWSYGLMEKRAFDWSGRDVFLDRRRGKKSLCNTGCSCIRTNWGFSFFARLLCCSWLLLLSPPLSCPSTCFTWLIITIWALLGVVAENGGDDYWT